MRIHLAILYKKYLNKILNFEKTIESRFSKVRCAPFRQVNIGDIIVLKEQSGPVRCQATVKDVIYFDDLTPAKIAEIRNQYNDYIKAEDDFWHIKRNSKYATLIFLEKIQKSQFEKINKKDRRAWALLSD